MRSPISPITQHFLSYSTYIHAWRLLSDRTRESRQSSCIPLIWQKLENGVSCYFLLLYFSWTCSLNSNATNQLILASHFQNLHHQPQEPTGQQNKSDFIPIYNNQQNPPNIRLGTSIELSRIDQNLLWDVRTNFFFCSWTRTFSDSSKKTKGALHIQNRGTLILEIFHFHFNFVLISNK